MKIVIAFFLTALMFVGCSSEETLITPAKAKLIVNKSLELNLSDQNGKAHTLDANTKMVVFAFSKDVGHLCNNFFATKDASYLANNNTLFVADISGAPSLIRSMFIMPGLKDFKHTVLILDDKKIASTYKFGMDDENIVVVYLKNKVITAIKTMSSTKELAQEIEK